MVTVVVIVCLLVSGTLETFEAAFKRCSAQLHAKERREVCYLFLNTQSFSFL